MTSEKLVKIIAPLVFSAALAASILMVIRGYVQYEGILTDVAVWSAFFSVFGIVYAIVAGFLLVTVLTKYTDIGLVIENELNAIETLRDFTVYLSDDNRDIKGRIEQSLHHYTSSLLNKEWLDMSDAGEPMDSDTSEELYEIMRQSKSINVNVEKDGAVFSAIIENISHLAQLRTRRISLANDKLPPRLKILLLFMSFVLVTAFMLLGVVSLYIHTAIVVSLCVAIHLLYTIIEDLDHPFYGVWNISRLPLELLEQRFASKP